MQQGLHRRTRLGTVPEVRLKQAQMKKKLLRSGAILLGALFAGALFEISLRIVNWPRYKTPQQVVESENAYPVFKYFYADIYDEFFKKTRKGNIWMYEPQRKEHQSRSFPVRKESGTSRIFILGGSVAQQVSYALQEYLKS